MGYRSEVALLLKNTANIPTDIKDSDVWKMAAVEEGGDFTLLHWNHIKWYRFGNDPIIQQTHAWLDQLEETDYQIFILGEEMGDYEFEGDAMNEEGCQWYIGPIQYLDIIKKQQVLSAY